MERDICTIMKSGAKPEDAPTATTASGPYTAEEITRAISRLRASGGGLGCATAALKSSVLAGRRVTACLANLSQHMCITSSLRSLRKYSPRHESGPRIVRSTSSLRPISICSDLAQLLDALWVERHFPCIQEYSGDSQVGGVSDPLSLVLAVVLLGEVRSYLGLAIYLAFIDLKWGFDVAGHDGMLLGIFWEGVRGRESSWR